MLARDTHRENSGNKKDGVFSVQVTLFACALALERNPPLAAKVREGLAAGRMDICCHGYRWEEHYQVNKSPTLPR